MSNGREVGLHCCCFYLSLWDFYLKELRVYCTQKVNYWLGILPSSTWQTESHFHLWGSASPARTQLCCLETDQTAPQPHHHVAPQQFPDILVVLLFNTNKKKSFKTPKHGNQHSVQCWLYQYIDTEWIKNRKPLIFKMKQKCSPPLSYFPKVLNYEERKRKEKKAQTDTLPNLLGVGKKDNSSKPIGARLMKIRDFLTSLKKQTRTLGFALKPFSSGCSFEGWRPWRGLAAVSAVHASWGWWNHASVVLFLLFWWVPEGLLSSCARPSTALMGRPSPSPLHAKVKTWARGGRLFRVGGLQPPALSWAPLKHVSLKPVIPSRYGCEQWLDTDKMMFLIKRMCYPGGITSI